MIMDSPSVVRGKITRITTPFPVGDSITVILDAICPYCKHVSEQSVTLPSELAEDLADKAKGNILILRGFSGDYTVKEVPTCIALGGLDDLTERAMVRRLIMKIDAREERA